MAWKPKRTREQLPPEGEQIAEILNVEKATSKRGNEMVVIEFLIAWLDKSYRVKDWIVKGFSAWKAEAIRLALCKDSAGFRLSNQVGARLYLRISHREPQSNYGWSADIAEYLVPGPSGPPSPALNCAGEDQKSCPY